ncbi:MAG TPA: ParM/StbA family protein [Verrucomicrobiae bacterium]|nr:ParM/StbA family protein [Verrucomicrobiae bacterium]
MQIIGLDVGFGFTKATNGREVQLFKSVVGDAAETTFNEQLLPGKSALGRHIALNGETYYVGEVAEQQSRGRGFTLDPTQFLAKYARTLAVSACAPLADGNSTVRIVSGLPISFFRKYKDTLTQLLQQRHVVTVFKPNGDPEERALNVEKVRVIPQPFGSLFNLMLNDMGKPTSQRFLTEKIGVIDIGFRTADYTISDKTKYSERGSQSTDSGISVAFSAIANALQEKSGVAVELFRLYDSVTRGTIKIKGKRYDITSPVKAAFTALATRVATEANRLWADDWDLDAIVITGGGGAVLAPYLQPLLEGEVIPVPADQDARLNNVQGYYKYGQHLWSAGGGAV